MQFGAPAGDQQYQLRKLYRPETCVDDCLTRKIMRMERSGLVTPDQYEPNDALEVSTEVKQIKEAHIGNT